MCIMSLTKNISYYVHDTLFERSSPTTKTLEQVRTILALEDVSISTCGNSRVIIFLFNSKAQWQMFLIFYGRPIYAPLCVGHR